MIENKDQLIDRFGYWPTFHDAETLDVVYKSDKDGNSVLDFQIYVFEISKQSKDQGFLKRK